MSVGCSRPEISELSANSVILAFGDSITVGYGLDEAESYPAKLSQLIGIPVIRSGVSGEDTNRALRRLPGVLDEYEPDLVLLCIGGNDMLRKQSRTQMEKNLRKMIRLIQERGTDVILIAVPEPNVLLSVPKIYKDLAEEFGIPIEERVIRNVLSDSSLKKDPIHPNAEGYQNIAEAMFVLLERSGAL